MALQFSPMILSYRERTAGGPIISRPMPNRSKTSSSASAASTTPSNTTTSASTSGTSSSTLPSSGTTSTTNSAGTSGSTSPVNTLFPVNAATIPAPAAPTDPVPTAQSVFGANPWVTNPTGNGPSGSFSYNIGLPDDIDEQEIRGSFANGTLIFTIGRIYGC